MISKEIEESSISPLSITESTYHIISTELSILPSLIHDVSRTSNNVTILPSICTTSKNG